MSTALTFGHILWALCGYPPAEDPPDSRGDLAAPVRDVVVDSRLAQVGSVFVALRGQVTDGHRYVRDAFDQGAIGAIVEQVPEGLSAIDLSGSDRELPSEISLPVCLVVRDALVALQRVAAWWRARFAVRVTGITGSVGKTTTKEFVASVLGQRYRVLKSQGNYNNEIGLPLTLLQLEDHHEHVVLEMGTYGLGEITLLTEIARPHIGIVTNVGPVHLERMGTVERIAQAKSELPQALPPNGVAVLNGDDRWVRAMAEKTRARAFLYGLTPDCDLWADEVVSRGLEGVRFQFHYQDETVHVHIPLLGQHSVHTALRAAAAGLIEELSWDEIVHGLRTGEQLRLMVVPGANGSMLLDDTYNSSPDSAIAALNLLDEFSGRKVAVMGDMLELGGYAVEGHRRVGRRVMDVASILITIGELGALIGREAMDYGMPPERVIQTPDNDAAIVCLQDLLQEGDIVLVKGSRGLAMEQIVESLARPPANGSADEESGGR